MATKKQDYGNDSISALKGADRVRKRPGVIFGSDGLEGCEHAVFEILSNSIDEAREGHGRTITVTRFADRSIQVEDAGRGCPVDWNEKEQRYNWELVYCELYAGGKYDNVSGDNYEYSLGLNGLGACATQYASRYMDVTVWRDGFEYTLHFQRGEIVGELGKTPLPKSQARKTDTPTRWLPDLDVFRNETEPGRFEEAEFLYENGIMDYVTELAGEGSLTAPVFWQTEKKGRDRADKPEYKVKLSVACCFSNKVNVIEHYHNSSWLEHGGSPEKAAKSAFVSAIDKYLRDQGKYQKSEGKITWADIEDCLVLVSNNFSTQTSYENQTKKAITNKFVQEAMTEFLRSNLEIYFIENPFDAEKIGEQVLLNKRSREKAEETRLNVKKKLSGSVDIANRVQKFVDCRTKDVDKREIYIVEGDSALGSVKLARDSEYQGIMPVRGKILNCLKADYARIREGYVYIAETPLFEINSGDKTWFAYSDKEKNDIVKSLEGKKYKIDRSKGLGENDPDMMWLTTMNPETRRLIRVMPEDVEQTAAVFDLLLGDNLQGRKDHIAENGYKYLELADIS